MNRYSILGFFRDGEPRHGWGIMREYEARAGIELNSGNVGHQIEVLETKKWIQRVPTPPGVDKRRITFQVTEAGTRAFAAWLRAPATLRNDMPGWLLFYSQLPREEALQLLEDYKDDLWHQLKVLNRPQTAAFGHHNGRGERSDPDDDVQLYQRFRLTAELNFVGELIRRIQTGKEG